jgi:hypothetical protein
MRWPVVICALLLSVGAQAQSARSALVSAADWQGWWRLGPPVKGVKSDLLLLSPGDKPGAIRVSGRAYWYGLPGVIHFGQVNGEAVPAGNQLHVTDGDCVLDLTLVNAFEAEIQAVDNQRCGGMNVRFSGTWHRFAPRSRRRQP